MSFQFGDSIGDALNLVTLRDQNPELSRSVYGNYEDSTANKNSNDNQYIPSFESFQQSEAGCAESSSPQIKSQSKPQPKPQPKPQQLNDKDSHNFVSSKCVNPSVLFLTPSIRPPNKGNTVSTFDDLVDLQDMNNMMSLFSSVPELKVLVDPGKFSRGIVPEMEPKSIDSNIDSKSEVDNIVTDTGCIINFINIDNISEPEVDTDLITNERDEIKQSWSILQIATDATPKGWINTFRSANPELQRISRDLEADVKEYGHFFPLKQNIFRAFDVCPLDAVKVVIIGQDPYHSVNHNGYPIAQGMSFSVGKENSTPPSLQNIYKEISRSIPDWQTPGHGDLTNWSNQGVLMLNTCLTVRPHKAKSHGGLWMGFISKVLNSIAEKNPRCIYVLWGRDAENVASQLSNKNVILVTSHPSGFSAHKGFNGCGHFAKINQELEAQGRNPIDWSL